MISSGRWYFFLKFGLLDSDDSVGVSILRKQKMECPQGLETTTFLTLVSDNKQQLISQCQKVLESTVMLFKK